MGGAMRRGAILTAALALVAACAGGRDGVSERADDAVAQRPDPVELAALTAARHSDPEPYLAALRAAYVDGPAAWPPATLHPAADYTPLGPVPPRPRLAEGTPEHARAELGRLLFFDGRLSGTGQMACASCHVAELGWADGRARSLGHGAGQLQRNTPSMLNAAHQRFLFADGRAESLEELVVAVLINEHEMATEASAVEQAVAAIPGYAPHFEAAFGDDAVSMPRIAHAIADHVRTIVSEPSADFDDFLEGESAALSDAALRGLHLFRTEAGCINCHNGPTLSDGGFHSLGLTYYKRKHEDLGRYLVTGAPEDVGRFRTPGLRNVARTAPYTHTGFFPLDGLMNIYNAGGARPRRPAELADDPLWPEPSEMLTPLGLSKGDRADLVAFLESLTERRRRDLVPELP